MWDRLGCKNGEELGLDVGEGHRSHGERYLGGARLFRWSVVCVHRESESDTLRGNLSRV
jgi:hypothetical protein